MDFTLEHRFDVSKETYIDDVFFNEELTNHMNATLGLSEKQLLEEEDNDSILRRTFLVKPKQDLPRALKKLFGKQGLGYYETTVYYKGQYRLEWSMKTEMMSDRIHGGGEILIIGDGDGVLRRVTGTINASIFGVGKLIEKTAVDNIKTSYDKAAQVTTDWLKENNYTS